MNLYLGGKLMNIFGKKWKTKVDADNYINETVAITGQLLQEQLTDLEQFCISIKETA